MHVRLRGSGGWVHVGTQMHVRLRGSGGWVHVGTQTHVRLRGKREPGAGAGRLIPEYDAGGDVLP